MGESGREWETQGGREIDGVRRRKVEGREEGWGNREKDKKREMDGWMGRFIQKESSQKARRVS